MWTKGISIMRHSDLGGWGRQAEWVYRSAATQLQTEWEEQGLARGGERTRRDIGSAQEHREERLLRNSNYAKWDEEDSKSNCSHVPCDTMLAVFSPGCLSSLTQICGPLEHSLLPSSQQLCKRNFRKEVCVFFQRHKIQVAFKEQHNFNT